MLRRQIARKHLNLSEAISLFGVLPACGADRFRSARLDSHSLREKHLKVKNTYDSLNIAGRGAWASLVFFRKARMNFSVSIGRCK